MGRLCYPTQAPGRVLVPCATGPENCHGAGYFNCVQMRVSGCKNHYKFVLRAGAKAKTVTSLLTLSPSVLCGVLYFSVMKPESQTLLLVNYHTKNEK